MLSALKQIPGITFMSLGNPALELEEHYLTAAYSAYSVPFHRES